jgi:hypothetical protein
LIVAITTPQPCESLISRESKMEIIFRPLVVNNFEHWQVFNNDAQIIRSMNNLQEFAQYEVDWRSEYDENLKVEGIMERKYNKFLKGPCSFQ